MKIIKKTQNNEVAVIAQITSVLSKGGLVILPTDTVYGLSADTNNKEAVAKLNLFKSRPFGKPISVFVENLDMAQKYVKISSSVKSTLETLLLGPYTIILPSKHILTKELEAEDGSLGIRVLDNKFINKLVRVYGKPITATSANLSGRAPHYSVTSFLNSLPKSKQAMIDLIVDGGKLPHRKPSTVIDLSKREMKILRKGDADFHTTIKLISSSVEETKKVAFDLLRSAFAQAADKPIVFLLEGELGVGKTVFVKGIGEALGIENIISPTFVIMYEYNGQTKPYHKLFHFDFYKIEEESEFDLFDFQKMLQANNIIVIEWGEKSQKLVSLFYKSQLIHVKMEYVNKKTRKINIFTNY